MQFPSPASRRRQYAPGDLIVITTAEPDEGLHGTAGAGLTEAGTGRHASGALGGDRAVQSRVAGALPWH